MLKLCIVLTLFGRSQCFEALNLSRMEHSFYLKHRCIMHHNARPYMATFHKHTHYLEIALGMAKKPLSSSESELKHQP